MAGASVFYPSRSIFPKSTASVAASFDPVSLFDGFDGELLDFTRTDSPYVFSDLAGTVPSVDGGPALALRDVINNRLYSVLSTSIPVYRQGSGVSPSPTGEGGLGDFSRPAIGPAVPRSEFTVIHAQRYYPDFAGQSSWYTTSAGQSVRVSGSTQRSGGAYYGLSNLNAETIVTPDNQRQGVVFMNSTVYRNGLQYDQYYNDTFLAAGVNPGIDFDFDNSAQVLRVGLYTDTGGLSETKLAMYINRALTLEQIKNVFSYVVRP